MNKNTFGFGALMALVLPLVGFAFWMLVNYLLVSSEVMDKDGNLFQFSQKTRVLLSACLNLIPFQIAATRRWDYMLRGCGVVTLMLLLAWAYYYNLLNF